MGEYQPRYIRTLYDAAACYYLTKGTAWYDRKVYIDVLKLMLKAKRNGINEVSEEDINSYLLKRCGQYSKRVQNFLKSRGQGYYIVRFFWHAGLIVPGRRRKCWKLSSAGAALAEAVERDETMFVLTLRDIALRMKPFRVFLEYVRSKGHVSSLSDVKRELGDEMLYWTSMFSRFGLETRSRSTQGVRKPFNGFVDRELIVPLLEDVGLLKRGTKGYTVTSPTHREDHEVIKTRPREPLIHAAYVTTAMNSADTLYIVSPWFYGEEVVNALAEAVLSCKSVEEVVIVTRSGNAGRGAGQLAKKVAKAAKVTHYIHKTLHAKVVASVKICTESSANLTPTSLFRNYEVGTLYWTPPNDILAAVEAIVSTAEKTHTP